MHIIRRKLAERCLKADYSEAVRISNELLNYYASLGDVSSEAYGEDLFNTAFAYENISEHKKAIRFYTESSRIVMDIKGENVDFFYRLMNIAAIYCKTGEYLVAIDLLDSILNGLKRKKINDADIKYLCYYNMGSAYCSLDKHNEGIDSFKKARRYCKNGNGSNRFDVLYSLGIAHMEIHEYKKSSLIFAEAVNVIRYAEPQNIPELLNVLVSLSESFEKMGDYAKSIEKLYEILQIMDSMLVKGNLNYTAIQKRIAVLYFKVNACDEAMSICKDIAENTKNLVGENSIQYANILRDIALIYKEAGKCELSIESLKKGIEIKTALLGVDSRESIKDTIILIGLYVEINDLKQALDILIQTINVMDIMDENEAELDEFMIKLAELYLSLGEYGNLYNAHSRAVELSQLQEYEEL